MITYINLNLSNPRNRSDGSDVNKLFLNSLDRTEEIKFGANEIAVGIITACNNVHSNL